MGNEKNDSWLLPICLLFFANSEKEKEYFDDSEFEAIIEKAIEEGKIEIMED